MKMFSACEDCLFTFPDDMTACPHCYQATDWLTQTYDVDAPHACVSCDSTADAVAVK